MESDEWVAPAHFYDELDCDWFMPPIDEPCDWCGDPYSFDSMAHFSFTRSVGTNDLHLSGNICLGCSWVVQNFLTTDKLRWLVNDVIPAEDEYEDLG